MKTAITLFILLYCVYYYTSNKNTIDVITNVGNTKEFITEINLYRHQIDPTLPNLTYDKSLEKAAYIQVSYNFEHNQHGHVHPDFKNVLYKVKSVGYKSNVDWFYCAENVTRSINYNKDIEFIEEDIVNAYVNSTEHRASLLEKKFTKIGAFTIFKNNKLYNCLILSE